MRIVTCPEVAPSGTRTTTKLSELTTNCASASPKLTRGRWVFPEAKPEPRIITSPPGIPARGVTSAIRGLPLLGFRVNNWENPLRAIYIPSQTAARTPANA